jgi:hypothetical protein
VEDRIDVDVVDPNGCRPDRREAEDDARLAEVRDREQSWKSNETSPLASQEDARSMSAETGSSMRPSTPDA